jgi:ACT domain-containing protein
MDLRNNFIHQLSEIKYLRVIFIPKYNQQPIAQTKIIVYDYHNTFERRGLTMKAILTVLGHDQVGIVAKVSTRLAELNVNIIDISQTLMHDNFYDDDDG